MTTPNESTERVFIRMDGVVHLALDGEHLVCMSATYDAADSEKDEALRWFPTPSTTVTCDICAKVIRLCHGVKVGKVQPMKSYR